MQLGGPVHREETGLQGQTGATLPAKGFEVRMRMYHKATVYSWATNKIVPLGDVKITNEISYVESSVTKTCNNPEKGIRRVRTRWLPDDSGNGKVTLFLESIGLGNRYGIWGNEEGSR